MASDRIGMLLRTVRAGDKHSVWNKAELRAPDLITLTSSAFEYGSAIPAAHAGQGVGENTSPELSWSGVPVGTAQLLLVIEDTDVPLPRPLLHTIALLEPGRTSLAAGELVSGGNGIRFLPASFGNTGYAGPRPIPGHGPHHYGFYLYSLDRAIQPDREPKDTRKLLAQVAGHITGRARLIGTYEQ
jgi:phosphatidylethanolamine-binding protein (PEBP) family uncharacterized protein